MYSESTVTGKADDGPVLGIDELKVSFPRAHGAPVVVDGASLSIGAGEVHGLVGESGSGKTMLARAVLALLPPGGEVVDGSIRFQDRELIGLAATEMRKLRGAAIGMVFQEPMMSLNPALRIGQQMAEAVALHANLESEEITRLSIDMLNRVRLPDPHGCLRSYPHEFSGGMRQRIMLASVLMARPALLLADEPTTALDVLIQQEVIEIMLEVVRDLGTAVLLITHDLGLVAKHAQKISVMQEGRIVEHGRVEDTLARPRKEYTQRLLAALPRRTEAGAIGTVGRTESSPVVEVRNLSVTFGRPSRLPWRRQRIVRAVDDVTFEIRRDETLAVVGESGSGKTTLGRSILKLVDKSSGHVSFEGRDIDEMENAEIRKLRRRMQIVFQDPYSSLDPRKRIGRTVGEGLRLVRGMSREQRRRKVTETLVAVDIDSGWIDRYPHELSGGQRQRIAIARAIITEPTLVVADEAVSALDLTVQAQVLNLLKRLQADMGFSYLFITHDLGVVEQIADRIMVMYRGRIVELGPRDVILSTPQHPYTCALLNAVPELAGDSNAGYRLKDREFDAASPPAGYHYDNWEQSDGRFVEVGNGHFVAFSIN